MSIKTSGAGATAAQNKYIARKYDRVNLLLDKASDEKKQVQDAAAVQGESVNEYIREAVRRRMDSGL